MPSRHRYSPYFPILFILLDLIALNLGFGLASQLRHGDFLYNLNGYPTLQLILNGLWVLVFFSARLHEISREFRLIDHLNRLLTGLVVNLSIVFAIWFIAQPTYYSREHLFFTYALFTLLIVIWRSTWHFVIRYYRARGFNYRNVVIVGNGDLAQNIIHYVNSNPGIGYNLKGIFGREENGVDRLGSISGIEKYAKKENVDIIFCILNEIGEHRVREIIEFAENHLIKVKIISQFSRIAHRNFSVQNYGTIPVLNVNAIPLDFALNRAIKRSFDIMFSSLVLISILSWLIPVVALLIRLDSKGPIFFKQIRHGKGNQPFLCWKFRTMVVNTDADKRQATKDDDRITFLGHILRRTSIDELPQFINVFLGDMSIVGPRPHPILLNEQFQPSIEKFWQRHAVKPGITGLAQAKGYRGETSQFSAMSGRIRLDRFYVKNWSMFLDLKIIALTIITLWRGNENAY